MTLEQAINKTDSMAKAARLLGIPFSTFKRRAIKLGLYKPNQAGKGLKKTFVANGQGARFITQDILAGKHPQYSTGKLKKRLLEEGYLKEICSLCPVENIWQGKPLVLHLDHIDGDNRNHSFENLRLLCPNCHSQTETYCGRNKRLKRLRSSGPNG